MRKETFDLVIKNLDSVIKSTQLVIGDIKCKEDLENKTIKEVNSITNWCMNIQSKMDKIFQTELYHLIGMGNLNGPQTSTLCQKIRELGSYRSYIKAVASFKIPTIPNVPAKANYNCEILGVNLSIELNKTEGEKECIL